MTRFTRLKDIALNDLSNPSPAVTDSSFLSSLTSTELDPVFWTPDRIGKPSAWWTHVPFAFWVTAQCAPRLFVELGTHNGVSYAAFCKAVERARLATRCFAVDTWVGDAHAGEFDAQIYNDLRTYHDKHWGAFSELLRCTFDEALPCFEDGTIDLLHIDGYHTYEAVRHDFESWRPKLSDRAVVLFHDTNVREREFGVFRYFAELATRYPSFEFLHGYGLGVLLVGSNPPAALKALCSELPAREQSAVRERFALLGARWLVATREELGHAQLHGQLEAAQQESRLQRDAAEQALRAEQEAVALRAQDAAAQAQAQVSQAQEQLAQAREEVAQAQGQIVQAVATRVAAENMQQRAALRVHELRGAAEALRGELEQVRSRTERETGDLRRDAELAHTELVHERDKLARLSDRHLQLLQAPPPGLKAQLLQRLARLIKRGPSLEAQAHAQALREMQSSHLFDSGWYLANYPDVASHAVDPADHYLLHGAAEGRDPGPDFSTQSYWECNPDVRASGVNPLLHYMRYGRKEGRSGGLRVLVDRARRGPSPQRAAAPSLMFISGEPDSPGHQYRVVRLVEAARANGLEATWTRADELAQQLDIVEGYDILIIWRTCWDEAVEAAIGRMHARGKKVVFDVDDLMVDPDLATVTVIDGIRSQFLEQDTVRQHYQRIRQTMLAADVCFTSTEELAFHMRWAGKTTHVVPNGFDLATQKLSIAAAARWREERDGLIRLGYAGGSRTHQRDFGLAVEAIARLLQQHPNCRLVLFRALDGTPLVDVHEYPTLTAVEHQIEWRPLQPLALLPHEMARFDINLAPLEFGNPFCEAKSELKFFEAALVSVPTVASPTGPFRRAIEHGKTGLLAISADDWFNCFDRLVRDPQLRARLARAAYHSALARFGPLQRSVQFGAVIDQLQGGLRGERGFALLSRWVNAPVALPKIYPSEQIFAWHAGGEAAVSVVVPLYNYEQYILEALDSVANQTLHALDLVIVDGHSTDNSLAVATAWAQKHARRFNRLVIVKNSENYGLGFCRNSAFDEAETPYVLPLDADNRLLPECCEVLLAAIACEPVGYVYPTIRHFGASNSLMGNAPYAAQRFAAGNYVDAMALVSKEAWALVGGFAHVRHGWEDYDFWCRLAERGVPGHWKDAVLAEYRVHPTSMMTMQTMVPENYRRLHRTFEARHPWVSLIDVETRRQRPHPALHLREPSKRSRLDVLLPILRCPTTGQKLGFDAAREMLASADGRKTWPIVQGRPVLSDTEALPQILPPDHLSNEMPDEALAIVRSTSGLVLNLSGGGSREKFDHVVEVEFAVFRHTDVIADAHRLPFDDETFEAAIVMNAFEHYREPRKVAAELYRVLKPGARLHIRTAFMQPLHERPWHFYNCTRHGLEEWFKNFDTELLHVSENFCPNHSIAWLASECESALRLEVSSESGDNFRAATVGELVDLWRDPSRRDNALWTDFGKLPQYTQEVTAAGFEFFGRKPDDRPVIIK